MWRVAYQETMSYGDFSHEELFRFVSSTLLQPLLPLLCSLVEENFSFSLALAFFFPPPSPLFSGASCLQKGNLGRDVALASHSA